MTSEPKPKRTITKRLHHSPEVWAQARRDYLAGYTASAVSKRYGMSVDALRKRASKQGWCKAHHVHAQEIPPPLHPFPSEVEAVKTGAAQFASLWDEIAHEAQRAPQGVWSTWPFQGGRGAGKTRAGAEWLAAWADEFCIRPRPSETLAILRMGLRLGDAPQLVVTTTPKPLPALRVLRAEASDRADALVWALTALMTGGEGPRVRGFDYELRPRGLSG